MELTVEILNEEFLSWTQEHGNGRNKEGMRFGQYLHFKYEVLMGVGCEDGFYNEAPLDSYRKLFNIISK